MKKEDPKLLDHNYDGIQELDNPLPGWWVQTFIWTIIFAIGYYCYYELGNGPSLQSELKQDMAQIESQIIASKGQGFQNDEVLKLVTDSEKMKGAAKAFTEKCVSCHGDHAQGVIGPNLTDHYWIHGDGKPGSIATVINAGVLDKGMPAWGALLSRDDILSLAAYIVSLKDSKPAGAKAPQGTEYP